MKKNVCFYRVIYGDTDRMAVFTTQTICAGSRWGEPSCCGSSARLTPRSRSAGSSFPLPRYPRSEEHTSELQSRLHLACRLLPEKKTKKDTTDGTAREGLTRRPRSARAGHA